MRTVCLFPSIIPALTKSKASTNQIFSSAAPEFRIIESPLCVYIFCLSLSRTVVENVSFRRLRAYNPLIFTRVNSCDRHEITATMTAFFIFICFLLFRPSSSSTGALVDVKFVNKTICRHARTAETARRLKHFRQSSATASAGRLATGGGSRWKKVAPFSVRPLLRQNDPRHFSNKRHCSYI